MSAEQTGVGGKQTGADGRRAGVGGKQAGVGGKAIFAGGCFWCMEAAFEALSGVLDATSGYTGGTVPDPTYEQVSSGATGHFEAVLVRYDPQEISYRRLLDAYWRHIDPTDPTGQFHDQGSQYRTAIFYLDEEQKWLAEACKQALEVSGIFGAPIVTMILEAGPFYPAEAYHQAYHQTHKEQFEFYELGTGRDGFLDRAWKGHETFDFFPED